MQYFFILGRNPELSLAELNAILPEGYRVVEYSREVLVAGCSILNVPALMKRLGGTLKMGEILHNTHHVAYDTILKLLQDYPKDKKLFLGLSAYALDKRTKLPSARELRTLGIEAKRALQKKSYKIRLVTSREAALSSVIVKKEKLLNQGAEMVLLCSNQGRLLGRTLAVQEFEEASLRDFGRPVREMKVGMLPVQLAKIMINLARVPQSATILDPFCGFGTILAEASLMGYKNLIGADLERRMVEATRKNLEWLAQRQNISYDSHESADDRLQVFLSPVEELSKHITTHSVDAVVTEPYLGPSSARYYDRSIIIARLALELKTLYISAFREFSKILEFGGHVVFIMPAFRAGSRIIKTSAQVLPQIKKLGFTPLNLLPTSYSPPPTYSITYSRPNQRVLREIFVFQFLK